MAKIKFYTIFIPVFISLCLVSSLFSQVNIEKERKENQKGLAAKFGFSLSLFKGNTDIIRFNTDLRLDFNFKTFSGFFLGNLTYGEKNGDSYINKGFAHIRFIREITAHLMVELYSQLEFNHFILLKKRALGGGGIRYRLVHKKNSAGEFNLYTGIGIMYEDENFKSSSGSIQKTDSSLLKSTNYLSAHYKSKKFELRSVTYYQTDFSSDRSDRIYSDLKLSIGISKRLQYTAGLNYRYDSNPAPSVKSYDLQIRNGLSFKWD